MNIEFRSIGRFKLGLLRLLVEKDLLSILSLIKPGKAVRMPGLEGRVALKRFEDSASQRYVIKEYRRGGVLGRLLGNIHLRMGEGRALRELKFLIKAKNFGVAVPEPVGFIEEGGLVYKTWLILDEIPMSQSLSELGKNDSDSIDRLIDEAASLIGKLIKARIFHVDLHPGNVLVDSSSRVFLLDFDKATDFAGELKELRDLYLCRWRRAVIKHKLPPLMAERMSMNLRRLEVWDSKDSAAC